MRICSLLIAFFVCSGLDSSRVFALRDRLLDAIHMADVDRVKELLAEKDSNILTSQLPVSVTQIDKEHGRTSLLSCGLDPQFEDLQELDSRCTKIAKLLKEAGADLSHVDKHGWNAIAFASVKGMTRLIRYLIKAGVHLDLADETGKTPLMKACTHGYVDTIKLLLKNGADVSRADQHGWTPLHFIVRQAAANEQFLPIFYLLMEHIKTNKTLLDFQDRHGRTALMYAAAEGSLEVVDKLILSGADSRLHDKDLRTALDLTSSIDINRRLTHWNVKLTLLDHEKWLEETAAEFEEDINFYDSNADFGTSEF